MRLEGHLEGKMDEAGSHSAFPCDEKLLRKGLKSSWFFLILFMFPSSESLALPCCLWLWADAAWVGNDRQALLPRFAMVLLKVFVLSVEFLGIDTLVFLTGSC